MVLLVDTEISHLADAISHFGAEDRRPQFEIVLDRAAAKSDALQSGDAGVAAWKIAPTAQRRPQDQINYVAGGILDDQAAANETLGAFFRRRPRARRSRCWSGLPLCGRVPARRRFRCQCSAFPLRLPGRVYDSVRPSETRMAPACWEHAAIRESRSQTQPPPAVATGEPHIAKLYRRKAQGCFCAHDFSLLPSGLACHVSRQMLMDDVAPNIHQPRKLLRIVSISSLTENPRTALSVSARTSLASCLGIPDDIKGVQPRSLNGKAGLAGELVCFTPKAMPYCRRSSRSQAR